MKSVFVLPSFLEMLSAQIQQYRWKKQAVGSYTRKCSVKITSLRIITAWRPVINDERLVLG
jgi:hypothetical protein